MSKIILFFFQIVFILFTKSEGMKLESFNIRPDLLTVSGSSAGGTMAQHMFVSYSSIFKGFSTISHAFYRCGPGDGNVTAYDKSCTNARPYEGKISEMYPATNAVADIKSYFSQGLIDDPENMENKPMYIFAGSSSRLFNLHQGLGAVTVFEPFINNIEKIKIRVQAAAITLPSDGNGLPNCTESGSLFVSNCGFSAAFEGLQWLLGPDLVSPARPEISLQPLLEFDQTEFFKGFGESVTEKGPGMDSTGYLYVPKQCEKENGKKCLLHIYFHGCRSGREFVGPNHTLYSGYLELAEANGIIMLFPQSISNQKGNTAGCWDTFGFTGKLYATQAGAQVTVVKNMLDRITGNFSNSLPDSNQSASSSQMLVDQRCILFLSGFLLYLLNL